MVTNLKSVVRCEEEGEHDSSLEGTRGSELIAIMDKTFHTSVARHQML